MSSLIATTILACAAAAPATGSGTRLQGTITWTTIATTSTTGRSAPPARYRERKLFREASPTRLLELAARQANSHEPGVGDGHSRRLIWFGAR